MFNSAFAGLQKIGKALARSPSDEPAAPGAGQVLTSVDVGALRTCLGGPGNVLELTVVAGTRLRARLADTTRFDAVSAGKLGVVAVAQAAPDVLHLIVGNQAAQWGQAIQLG